MVSRVESVYYYVFLCGRVKSLSINDKEFQIKQSCLYLKLSFVALRWRSSHTSRCFSESASLELIARPYQLSDFLTVRYNMAHFTPGITKRVAKQQSYLQFRDLEFSRWFHFTWEGTKPKAIESMKVNKSLKSSG